MGFWDLPTTADKDDSAGPAPAASGSFWSSLVLGPVVNKSALSAPVSKTVIPTVSVPAPNNKYPLFPKPSNSNFWDVTKDSLVTAGNDLKDFGTGLVNNEKQVGQDITTAAVGAEETPYSSEPNILAKAALAGGKVLGGFVNRATSGIDMANPIATDENGKQVLNTQPGIVTRKQAEISQLTDEQSKFTDQLNNSLASIRRAKAAGLNTTDQVNSLKFLLRQTPGDISDILPSVNKTNMQVLGDIAGTGIDIGTLAIGAPEIAEGLDSLTVAEKAVPKSGLDVAKNAFIHLGKDAGIGYGYDVANNLQQGKTGKAIFKPGAGTILGGSIGAIPGAVEVGKDFANTFKNMSYADFQAGFVRNPLSMFDDDTQAVGNKIKANDISKEDFINSVNDPANGEAVEDFKANLAVHDMSVSQFYDLAKQPRDIAPKIKSLPYNEAEYSEFLNKIDMTDDQFKKQLVKQGFDGYQLQDENTPKPTVSKAEPKPEPEPLNFKNPYEYDAKGRMNTKEIRDEVARVQETNPGKYDGFVINNATREGDKFYIPFSQEEKVAESVAEKGSPEPKVITDRKSSYTPEEQSRIDELTNYKSLLEQQAKDHPGSKLSPFISKKEGQFKELPTTDARFSAAKNAQIEARRTNLLNAARSAFEDTEHGYHGSNDYDHPDVIQKSIEDYHNLKQQIKDTGNQIRDVKAGISESKLGAQEEAAIRKLQDRNAAKTEADIASNQRYAERKKAFDEGVARAKAEEEKRSNKRIAIDSQFTKEDKQLNWFQKFGAKLFPTKYADKDFSDAIKAWESGRIKAPILAEKEIGRIGVPKGQGLETILDYQAGKYTPFSAKIKEVFDGFFKEENERGFDVGYRENYLPQIYAEKPDVIKQKVRDFLASRGMNAEEITDYMNNRIVLKDGVASSLGVTPFFEKQRVFKDYKTAMEWGLTPRFTDPDQLAAYTREQLEKRNADRKLVETLKDKGSLIPTGEEPVKWKPVQYLPLGQRGYSASPLNATILDGMFKADEDLNPLSSGIVSTGKGAIGLQRVLTTLGIPTTDINAYSIGRMALGVTGGDLKVLKYALKGNFPDKVAQDFVENHKYLEYMADQNINIGQRMGTYDKLYDTFFSRAKSFGKNVGDLGLKNPETYKNAAALLGKGFEEVMDKKTFQGFMPLWTMHTFKDSYEAAIKSGLEHEEASKLAGDITKRTFGMIDHAGRSKVTQGVLRTAFFAPPMRGSVLGILANAGEAGYDFVKNFGGVTGKLDPTLVNSRKQLLGILVSYFGLYNGLNKVLNGNYIWNNPSGHQFDLRIPTKNGNVAYVPFLPGFAAVARAIGGAGLALGKGDFKTAKQQAEGLLSTPVQIVTDIAANKDYFGNPIYLDSDTLGQKAKKIAAYTGLQVNSPLITDTINIIKKKEPLYQSLIKMSDIPIKFSTTSKEATSAFYDAIDKKTLENARADNKVKPIYQHVQELVNEGKTDDAQQIVDGLTDAQYASYKRIKSNDKTKQTKTQEAQMFPVVLQVKSLVDSGQTDQAQQIVNNLSDQDYKYYQMAKARLPASEQY